MSDQEGTGRRAFGRGKRTQTGPPPPPAAPAAPGLGGVQSETSEIPEPTRGRGRGQPLRMTPPRTPGSTSEITEETTKLSLASVEEDESKKQPLPLAIRPGTNSAGRKIKLQSNHFEIMLPPSLQVLQYEVTINVKVNDQVRQKVLNREECRAIFWAFIVENASMFGERYNYVYDGASTMFALQKDPILESYVKDVSVKTKRESSPRPFVVTLRFLRKITVDLNSPQQTLQWLDLLCRQNRSLHGTNIDHRDNPWFVFGSNTYRIPERGSAKYLGGGCEMWPGLFTSAHIGAGRIPRPLLNIDMANGTFYCNDMSVLKFLIESLNDASRRQAYNITQLTADSRFGEFELKVLKSVIIGLKVTVTHRQDTREYVVKRIGKTAVDTVFTGGQDNRETSVAEYFRTRYGALQFPRLPLLQVGSKRKFSYLPIEVCKISYPQRRAKQLSDTQISTLVKLTALPAPERREKILEWKNNANMPGDSWLQKNGITVSPEMVKLVGHILPPTKVEYHPSGGRGKGGPIVEQRMGEWSIDGQQFFSAGGDLKSYGLLFPFHSRQSIEPIFTQFHRGARELGFNMAPKPAVTGTYNSSSVDNRIEEEMTSMSKKLAPNDNGTRVVFVVVEKKGSEHYAEVKRVGDVVLGIMTQCMQAKTVESISKGDKKSRQTLQNLLLKINAKMGGVGNRLPRDLLMKQMTVTSCTLFVGADISHPPPSDRAAPSITALVANIDVDATRYSASICVQRGRETITNLTNPMKQRLLAFQQYAKQKPTRIVFYRDGVSESQFQDVLRNDLQSIRVACRELDMEYRPKITYVVAMKRHHTRLFCMSREDECGRAKNVPPGTMVDHTITSPFYFDFYLCSHIGIQGTSRPIRYTVLHDENNFSADEMQTMTYGLSHVYCRCTRSVSIPTPIYYAHLASLRAKQHLSGNVIDDGSDRMSSDSGREPAQSTMELQNHVTVHMDLTECMYFV